eukprot:4641367-Amphidinium_carterae.1
MQLSEAHEEDEAHKVDGCSGATMPSAIPPRYGAQDNEEPTSDSDCTIIRERKQDQLQPRPATASSPFARLASPS